MEEADAGRRIEGCGDPVREDQASCFDRVTGGRLEPRVRGDDEKGRKVGSQEYEEDGSEVRAL